HVRDMLEALSRIDLTKEPGVFAALLEELADGAERQRDEQHGICYVVISTSVREQTVSGLCRFAERIGEKVTWLSPVAPDMPVPQIPQELAQLLQYRRLVRR
ncbi:MAG: hypothetical protein IJT34_08015, partial [Butyrivibrio sp.]|nr:hypothetical protein [Butyrivibrio sp.]